MNEWVCMCVYVCVSVYVCVWVCMCVCECVCVWVCGWMNKRTNKHTNKQTNEINKQTKGIKPLILSETFEYDIWGNVNKILLTGESLDQKMVSGESQKEMLQIKEEQHTKVIADTELNSSFLSFKSWMVTVDLTVTYSQVLTRTVSPFSS